MSNNCINYVIARRWDNTNRLCAHQAGEGDIHYGTVAEARAHAIEVSHRQNVDYRVYPITMADNGFDFNEFLPEPANWIFPTPMEF